MLTLSLSNDNFADLRPVRIHINIVTSIGPTPPGTGGNCPGFLFYGFEIDIADSFSFFSYRVFNPSSAEIKQPWHLL